MKHIELAFRETGQGRPLVILHGLFGQSDNWNTLAKKFGENGFRVFTVDQRNHGLSPHSEEWTYEAMAGDLYEFIRKHDLREPLLLGHSMGGKTVLQFEKSFPGTAGKIIVADIAARKYDQHHDNVLKALHSVDFNRISNRKEAEETMSTFIEDYGTRQFLLKNIYWKDGAHKQMDWRFNLNVISAKYDNISEAIGFFESKAPALIVKGERSRYISAEDEQDFRKRFENCEIVTIPGAGHWVHAEKPQEFYEAVFSFISD